MKKNFLILLVLVACLGLVSATGLVVVEPIDGNVYPQKSVLIHLTTSDYSNFYYKEDLFGTRGWTRLCRKTTDCERTIRFREGEHQITIKSSNRSDDSEFIGPISFKIDSKAPRIVSTYPRRNKITNGSLFYAKYTEVNLQETVFHYGTYLDMRELTRTDCPSGKFKECTFENVDLTDFDGQEIEYWFEQSDEVRTSESRRRNVLVDTTAPEVIDFEYEVKRRKVSFTFEVKEENFQEIAYLDKSELNPRWRRLCSSIRDGSCNRMKRFSKGLHVLDIIMTDKAGNSVMIASDETIAI